MLQRTQQPYFVARKLSELPTDDAYYMALVEESFRYDNGYGTANNPEYSSHDSLETIVFANEDALKAWVLEADAPKHGPAKRYKIIRVSPVSLLKTVTVEVRG